MRRRLLLTVITVFLAILVLLAGISAWILGTTGGARLLITTVSKLTSVEISAGSIRGRLWDGLRLEQVSIQWPYGDANAESLFLRWQPFYLITGNIVFTEVSVNNLRISDNRPEEKTDLIWPEVTGLPGRLNGWIDLLAVTGLSYRRGEDDPLNYNKILSTVLWYDKRLTLKDTAIHAESFEVKGTIAAGFDRPFLFLDAVIVPEYPLKAMDSFSVKATLKSGRPPVQVKGPVSITGSTGRDKKVSFSSEINITRYALTIEKMLIEEAGRKGTLSGEGKIDFQADTPEFSASLAINEMNLSPGLAIETNLAGTVTLKGTMDDYKGVFLLSNARKSWRSAELSGSFEGGRDTLIFLIQKGSWLGGSLHGKIESSWADGFSLHADMKARGLNPALVTSGWQGMINFDIAGRINAEWAGKDLRYISGMLEASGSCIHDTQRIEAKKTVLKIDWDDRRLDANFDLELCGQGSMKCEITASGPARLRLPESGKISIRLNKIDASVVRPWLPEGMDLEGMVSAQIKGKFLPEQRLDISGNSRISAGTARYVTEKGEISAELRTAGVSFIWREEALRGNLEIALADYGDIRGDFSLPVPARIPVSIIKDRGIRLSLKGKAEEKGLLSSFFPGLIQKSRGRLEIDIGLSGTWDKPLYAGRAELTDAGAYLPSSGISIKDVRANARFDKNSIIIESLSAKSGKGNIKGSAELTIDKFRLVKYKGHIEGSDFQAVYLPELQVVVSPDLTFQGRPGSVSVRGEIKVPELFVTESERELVKPSDDVIIVDEDKKPERRPETALDISVNVVFGKRVFIKMEGIDARLEGEVRVTAKGLDVITGNGVIKVVKGAYRKYGIDLDIKRGQAIFAGGPISNPTLDILAVREADDVKAGIIVSGTAMSPVVNLYSDPPMTDTDILSYIVLGHAAGADQAQIGLLSRAAGLLLSRGESATLQAKLQKGLGVDVLDIQAGSGDVARSALTVGKYLSPRLFISYGLSLFTGENVFRARYKLSRRWEIQTESGFDTGIDLFYKIEFR